MPRCSRVLVALAATAAAVPALPATAAEAKTSATRPVQPRAGSVWLGNRGRVQIQVEVRQILNLGLTPILTWPRVPARCEVYNPRTQTRSLVSRTITAGIPFAVQKPVRRGRFDNRITYGGQLIARYQGTFTRNRLRGSLQVFKINSAVGIECLHPVLNFDLLRQD
jgi:hypothetical protein